MAHAGYMERYTKSLAKQAVAEYAAVAKKHGVTPTELALAWCKQKWQVASTIIGATSMEQLKVRAPMFWQEGSADPHRCEGGAVLMLTNKY